MSMGIGSSEMPAFFHADTTADIAGFRAASDLVRAIGGMTAHAFFAHSAASTPSAARYASGETIIK